MREDALAAPIAIQEVSILKEQLEIAQANRAYWQREAEWYAKAYRRVSDRLVYPDILEPAYPGMALPEPVLYDGRV